MHTPINHSFLVNRPALLAISLGLLLLLATIIQTLHDHSHHDALGAVVGCEYCTSTPSYDAALSSHSLNLPLQFIDLAIVAFVDLLVVINPDFFQQSRAPPSASLS